MMKNENVGGNVEAMSKSQIFNDKAQTMDRNQFFLE